MAFGFVGTSQTSTAGATSLTITLASTAVVNNLLVINIKFGGATAASVTATDNASSPNTYATAIGQLLIFLSPFSPRWQLFRPG